MESIEKKALKSPVMLVIMDGFGYSPELYGNATLQAKMPTWRMFLERFPNTLLNASGEAVGLLPGYIGNSEVGHMTLGAGRVIESDLKRIQNAIDSGALEQNKMLIDSFLSLKEKGAALHLMGLLSDGGVHSHEKHLHFFVKLAKKIGISKVYIHAFLDGRDVESKSAEQYLDRLDGVCKTFGCGQVASIHGRFYAMDRDKNWERTEESYAVLTNSNKAKNQDWRDVLKTSYSNGITDEFIEPVNLVDDGFVKSGDGIVFFNFRPDRARQLTQAFIDPEFDKFKTNVHGILGGGLSFFITPTCYRNDFPKYGNKFLFEPRNIKHTLLDEISEQLAMQHQNNQVFVVAETEKYAHVTYFFRGMSEGQPSNESRHLIPSIKTKNYIQHPEMSAEKITEEVLNSLSVNPASFYLINYANSDMVGHSGNLDATVKACECIDKQIAKLYHEIVMVKNGILFVVADHGNAEAKISPTTGEELTAHTTNPVPFVMIGNAFKKCENFK